MAAPFKIQYADEAVADLKALRAYDQRKILDGIKLHLSHQAYPGKQKSNQGAGAAFLESISATSR